MELDGYIGKEQILADFTYDLRHPNEAYINKTRQPLIERNPVAFWKTVSFILAIVIVALLIKYHGI